MKGTIKQSVSTEDFQELTKDYQAAWQTSSSAYYYMMSLMNPFEVTTSRTTIPVGWEGVEFDILQDMIDFCEQHEPPIGYDPEM